MQEKNEEKYSARDRLKSLQVIRGWTWEKVAQELDVSESLVYALLAGRARLTEKVEFKLKQAEDELRKGADGTVQAIEEKYSKMNDIRAGVKELPHLEVIQQKALEDLFDSFIEELKQAREPERSKMIESLTAVNGELKRREEIKARGEAAAKAMAAKTFVDTKKERLKQ